MKQRRPQHQAGFTLVELLIATTVFSVILMAAAAALVQVGRMYYKGVVTTQVQNVARTVIDDVSRTIQFGDGSYEKIPAEASPPTAQPPIQVICVGNTRYTYVVGMQVNNKIPSGIYNSAEYPNQIRHALWQDEIGSQQCGTEIPQLQKENPYEGYTTSLKGKELLGNGMRLGTFDVLPLGGDGDVFTVSVTVIYGDDDLLDTATNPPKCKSSVVGGQWCAISALNSVVYSRSQ